MKTRNKKPLKRKRTVRQRIVPFSMEKIFPSGAWHCSTVLGDKRVSMSYQGYNKRESESMFRAELRELKRK